MAEGDVGSRIADLEFDPTKCDEPRIIHIAGEVYAIAYTGDGYLGELRTITINSAGAISAVSGGSLQFDGVYGMEPDIIHISGEVYAIAYRGPDSDGWLKTITIDSAGAMSLVSGGSLEFETGGPYNPRILNVSGNVYVIAYQEIAEPGKLRTVNISGAGSMSLVDGGSLEFDATRCEKPNIVHVAGNVYAIAYLGPDDHGELKTVTITAGGAMSLVSGGSLEFDDVGGYWPDIIHISGEVYAIAYRGPDNDGWLKTVTITAAGAMSLVSSGSLEFDNSQAYQVRILHVSGNVFAVIYQNPSYYAWAKTVTITDAGAISFRDGTGAKCSISAAYNPDMVWVVDSIYATVYQGSGMDGFVSTIGIETIPSAAIKHLMLMGIG